MKAILKEKKHYLSGKDKENNKIYSLKKDGVRLMCLLWQHANTRIL